GGSWTPPTGSGSRTGRSASACRGSRARPRARRRRARGRRPRPGSGRRRRRARPRRRRPRAGAAFPCRRSACRRGAGATRPPLFLADGDRRHLVALPDAVHVLHAARDLAEDRVAVVEVRLRAVGDVELRARGVRVLAAGHGERAAHVLVRVELGRNGVARAPGAGALRAAALHDETGHDAVERQAVVEALPRQRDEVLDGLRRVLREEFQADLVAVLERDDSRLLHGTTLIDLIRSPTRIVSTTSMPLLTCPNAVYLPFRKGAGPSMTYTWLPAESGSSLRAMPSTPRSNLRLLNSAFRV